MNFFVRMLLKLPAIKSHIARFQVGVIEGSQTASGRVVDANQAMKSTAVQAAVRAVSETISTIPLNLFEKDRAGQSRKADGNFLQNLVHNEPNPRMSSCDWRATHQAQAMLHGNSYSTIARDSPTGRPIALLPLDPEKVKVKRVDENHHQIFDVQDHSGRSGEVIDTDLIHIRGLSLDSFTGYDPIEMNKEAIGLGLAAEEFGSRFFGNGSWPGGVIESAETMTKEQAQDIVRIFEQVHQGPSKANKVGVLSKGMTWKAAGVDPERAQFLETRRFQVSEAARIFRMPPHMIGDLEKATFSNIEQQAIEFVMHTIRPWLVRWEQELNRKLLTVAQRKTMFFKHNVEGLLRGDTKSRFESYAIARQWGWMSVNEIRALEDMNGIGSAGDVFISPMNMEPTGSASMSKADLVKVVSVALKTLPREQVDELLTTLVGEENGNGSRLQ